MDGRSRNSRRKATSSVAAGPTVPSSNCASISVAPVKPLSCRRAKPINTFEAISQERGVGHAFMSDVASASCRSAGLKRRKATISGRTRHELPTGTSLRSPARGSDGRSDCAAAAAWRSALHARKRDCRRPPPPNLPTGTVAPLES
jgi:hypothetical protein